ncbi:DUF2087 domain-containing protein [Enterococcus sp. DIV0876]|uniref:DUF2087 domain-containing protein n=1 Tax=Enterococcus sp. DIV0876 TaxID=2774633 RepID=UPI003D2FBF99
MKNNSEYMLKDYQRGFSQTESAYHCLFCTVSFNKEEIYPHEGRFFTAYNRINTHITDNHGGPIAGLLAQSKEQTGLSESQQEILQLFAEGLKDTVIAQRLGISTSTVRNHRFKLKEKQRQAMVFLSIMSLLQETPDLMPHKGATMIDDRYAITADERKKIIATYFDETGFIKQFPSKEKRKLVVLSVLADRFDSEKNYSEAAVNDILKQSITDYVTVRRYLIEYGFMKRTNDGKTYWRS